MLATRARIGGNIRRAGAWAFILGAASLVLGGCADLARVTRLRPDPVDPTSPVAGRVGEASRAKVATPRFRDVPPLPTGVRPASSFKTAVASSNKAGDDLAAWVAANPSGLPQDAAASEAFAADQRARIPADQRAGVLEPVGTEEYAARLRALATPPPPPN